MKTIRKVIYCIAVMCVLAVGVRGEDFMSRIYRQQLEDMIMTFMPEVLEAGRGNCASMLEDFGRYYTEELPEDLTTFPGWNFDIKGHELEQSKMLVETEDGIFLKDDGYDANPCKENLWAENPTIRWIAADNEDFAVEQLDEAGYLRCTEMLCEKVPDLNEDALLVKGWHIEDDVYFVLTCDTSGAWQVRQYCFYQKVQDGFREITSFFSLPEAEVARVVRWAAKGVPAACNNLAIMMADGQMIWAADDENVEKLFQRSIAGGCQVAVRNLFMFYISIDAVDKLIELLKTHGRQLCLGDVNDLLEGADLLTVLKALPDAEADCKNMTEAEKIVLAVLASDGVGEAYRKLAWFALGRSDEAMAIDLLRKGMESGDKKSKKYYALAVLHSENMPDNWPEAERLLLEIIEETGDREACSGLGFAYYFSDNLPLDMKKGWEYLLLSCQPLLPDFPNGNEYVKLFVARTILEDVDSSEAEDLMMYQYLTEVVKNTNETEYRINALKLLLYAWLEKENWNEIDENKLFRYAGYVNRLCELETSVESNYLCGAVSYLIAKNLKMCGSQYADMQKEMMANAEKWLKPAAEANYRYASELYAKVLGEGKKAAKLKARKKF